MDMVRDILGVIRKRDVISFDAANLYQYQDKY